MKSRTKLNNNMPTNLLGTIVPDYHGHVQEVCHWFTANYLLCRAGLAVNYQINNTYGPLNFLYNTIHQLNLNRVVAGPIQPGDLIIIGNGPAGGALAHVTHSMIAISPTIWFGCNNLLSFGALFQNMNIPTDTLSSRREIDLLAINANLIPAHRTFNNVLGVMRFDVFR